MRNLGVLRRPGAASDLPVVRSTATGLVLRALVVVGLAIDAIVHFHLAPNQPPGGPGELSQVTLFYAEGAVSVLAALVLLVTGRRLAYLFAVLVAGSALGAVLLSRYVDIGAIGPIPDMYEPFWYFSKELATVAEAVALLAALAGLVAPRQSAQAGRRRRV